MKVTITKLRRERNSANGNPRWRVFTPGGVYLTSTDSQVGHLISEEIVGEQVSLTLDRNGCITDMH